MYQSDLLVICWQALQVYLLLMALLFLIYLHAYILRHGRHDDASDDQHPDKPLHHCTCVRGISDIVQASIRN